MDKKDVRRVPRGSSVLRKRERKKEWGAEQQMSKPRPLSGAEDRGV